MTNTPSPSLSPTISPAVNLLDTPQDESVLTFSDTFGNENVEATPEVLGSKVENEENTSQPFPWLAALFTIGGVGLVIYALIPFLKKDNNVSHPDEKQENN
jgi:hypothetical protein